MQASVGLEGLLVCWLVPVAVCCPTAHSAVGLLCVPMCQSGTWMGLCLSSLAFMCRRTRMGFSTGLTSQGESFSKCSQARQRPTLAQGCLKDHTQTHVRARVHTHTHTSKFLSRKSISSNVGLGPSLSSKSQVGSGGHNRHHRTSTLSHVSPRLEGGLRDKSSNITDRGLVRTGEGVLGLGKPLMRLLSHEGHLTSNLWVSGIFLISPHNLLHRSILCNN